jgi:hypothetical protein
MISISICKVSWQNATLGIQGKGWGTKSVLRFSKAENRDIKQNQRTALSRINDIETSMKQPQNHLTITPHDDAKPNDASATKDPLVVHQP